jgi:RNA polymerase sporulation-specific sigma factor
MNYIGHNDFEILYQIREGNEEALQLMFEKYSSFISKKIYKFNLQYDYEDTFQEGLMILNKSIRAYNNKYTKTFTRYFEMNLERKLMTIINKRRRRQEIFSSNELYIYEHNHNTTGNSQYFELYIKEIEKILTKEEFLVYTLRELKNFSVKFISDKLGLKDKQIYNTLHRSRAKIKIHFNN